MARNFKSEITKNNVSTFLRFFHECYKHGVEDASNVEDQEIREVYIDVMQTTPIFSKIGMEHDIKWNEWGIELLMYSRNLNKRDGNIIRNLIYSVKEYNKGYKCVFLRLCMAFYVKGVRDFNAYPLHQGMEYFLSTDKMFRWKRGFNEDIPLKLMDIFEDVHILTYELMRADMEARVKKIKGHTKSISALSYNTFLTIMNVSMIGDE